MFHWHKKVENEHRNFWKSLLRPSLCFYVQFWNVENFGTNLQQLFVKITTLHGGGGGGIFLCEQDYMIIKNWGAKNSRLKRKSDKIRESMIKVDIDLQYNCFFSRFLVQIHVSIFLIGVTKKCCPLNKEYSLWSTFLC